MLTPNGRISADSLAQPNTKEEVILALPRRPQGIESQILFKNFLKAPLTWKVILFLIARCLHANLLSAFPLNTVRQANRKDALVPPFLPNSKDWHAGSVSALGSLLPAPA